MPETSVQIGPLNNYNMTITKGSLNNELKKENQPSF